MSLSADPVAAPSDSVTPEHTFLTAGQVIARYGWGRTKGYRILRSEGFPTPIGGDRYRLDALMEWERRQQANSQKSPPDLPGRKRDRARTALPASRRGAA